MAPRTIIRYPQKYPVTAIAGANESIPTPTAEFISVKIAILREP